MDLHLNEEETKVLIKAIYNYHYDGLDKNECLLLDKLYEEINYQYAQFKIYNNGKT